MKKIKKLPLLLLAFAFLFNMLFFKTSAQAITTQQQNFINAVLPKAIDGYNKYKILPSVTIAQAIEESGWGTSSLAVNAKNLFGIKEFNSSLSSYNGYKIFNSWDESIDYHNWTLGSSSVYANFRTKTSYVDQCKALEGTWCEYGYNYANKLINYIQTYNLTTYDNYASLQGWVKSSDGLWWYYYKNGVRVTGWQQIEWAGQMQYFYFDQHGAMVSDGFRQLTWSGGTNWFYFDVNGVMAKGWRNITWSGGTNWFYFNDNGVMQTGWIKVDNKDYYLYPDGHMAVNTTIDGYQVGPDGAWIH